MSYDDAFASVAAWGGGVGPFSGIPTNQGIANLSVEFFTPSLQPMFAVTDISSGISTYKFLSINFDTDAQTLFGSLDVGKDSFGEGEPGSPEGQFYLTGVSFPQLHDPFLLQIVDSGGQFSVAVIPEPSTWSLCVVATVAFIFGRSKWLKREVV
jgi:hypothetical protein